MATTLGDPLVDLVVALVALFAAIGIVGLLHSGLYDRIGGDGEPAPDRAEPRPGTEAAAAERDLEIRQMLQARNERRVRQGLEPIDVDAELMRLANHSLAITPPALRIDSAKEGDARPVARHDPQLVEELRQLAEARNRRRTRRGEQPLDVRAEVQRALSKLDG
jgi:hypothetical protein